MRKFSNFMTLAISPILLGGAIGLLLAFGVSKTIGHLVRAQGPAVYEAPCRNGTYPLAQTLNPSTGKYRAYLCTDPSGNVDFNLGAGNSIVSAASTGNVGTITGSLGTFTIASASGLNITINPTNAVQFGGGIISKSLAFASLPAATNGIQYYCSDCSSASEGAVCAGSGSGKLAVGINSAWACF